MANVYWNQRMFQLHGDAKYADVLEKVLYNGLISGVGLDGKSFFYSNAMQIKNSASFPQTEPARAGWFECSCCPTNLARLFPALPGYVYGQNGKDIYVNLFVSGSADLAVRKAAGAPHPAEQLPLGRRPEIHRETQPQLPISTCWCAFPAGPGTRPCPRTCTRFAAAFRQRKSPSRSTASQRRTPCKTATPCWPASGSKNDVVEVSLPMEVRSVVANPQVQDNVGKVALQRGPVIYCAEWKDNDGKASNLIVPAGTAFTAAFKPDLLNGITELTATVPVVQVDAATNTISTVPQTLTAIPYYAWANRGKGEMTVWFPQRVLDVDLVTRQAAEAPHAK